MKIEEMCAYYGVELVRTSKSYVELPDEAREIGSSPTSDACCYWNGKKFVIVATRTQGAWEDGAFHELCHLLIGPASLRDEGALMPFQWELMKLLPPEQYEPVREVFSTYVVGVEKGTGIDVGPTDEFLNEPLWQENVRQAIKAGLLNADGSLKERKIPLKSWFRHLGRRQA